MDQIKIANEIIFSAIQEVFDGESDFFEVSNNTFKELKNTPKIPYDIEHWNQSQLRKYIDNLSKKIDYYANFIFDNRQFLRESRPEWYNNFNKLWQRLNDTLVKAKEIMCKKFNEDCNG